MFERGQILVPGGGRGGERLALERRLAAGSFERDRLTQRIGCGGVVSTRALHASEMNQRLRARGSLVDYRE